MPLSEKVDKYFKGNFVVLDDKKFHFASRLFLWKHDSFYSSYLQSVQSNFIRKGFLETPYTSWDYVVEKSSPHRLAQFQKFPDLLKYHDIALLALYAKTVFGHDVLSEGRSLLDKEIVENLVKDLLADKEAFSTLSTYAVSFVYIIYGYVYPQDVMIEKTILQTGEHAFRGESPEILSLKIYFYTHAIIGESLFYSRKIELSKMTYYLEMMQVVEKMILENYFLTSIDHKFEFLMCCRICGYSSSLESKIFDEAELSLSDKGDYLVDKQNYYFNKKIDSLYHAEHQNVLFLMANSRPVFVGE